MVLCDFEPQYIFVTTACRLSLCPAFCGEREVRLDTIPNTALSIQITKTDLHREATESLLVRL